MSGAALPPARAWGRWDADSWTTVSRAAATMVITHVVMATFWVLQAVVGVPYLDPRHPLPAALLLAALAALQARHSAAAARGVRPRGWRWTLVAVLALIVIPQWWFDGGWGTTTWVGVASALMLLPRRSGIAAAVAVVAVVWLREMTLATVDFSDVQVVVSLAYTLVIYFGGGVALWASVETYRVIRQLDATTASIGELAIIREQLRQAADVHDLLGQNLTAIGLRANLGRRLAERDPDAVRREASAIVDLATRALGDLHGAVHGDRAVRLVDEVAAARELLLAAGVHPAVELPELAVDAQVETVLAWCVREAATNVVRHADATRCEIGVEDGLSRLELHVVNDGAGHVEAGNGLRGMALRAASVGGRATWSSTGGVVRVSVDLPKHAPMTDVMHVR